MIIQTENKHIEELSHQDYHGKRLTVTISDNYNKSYHIKLDVGVHKHIDILQDTLLLDNISINDLWYLYLIKKNLILNVAKSISYIKTSLKITNNFNHDTFLLLTNLLEVEVVRIPFEFNRNNIFYTKEGLSKIISFIENFIISNGGIYKGSDFKNYWSTYAENKHLNNLEKKYQIKFWRNISKELSGYIPSYKNLCKFLKIDTLIFDLSKESSIINLGQKISLEYIKLEDYEKLIDYLNSHTKNERFNEQRLQTCLERFGAINNSCTQEWKTKVNAKSLQTWGTLWPLQSSKLKNEIAKNNINKYGVESLNGLEWKVEKQKKTYNERYKDPNSEYSINRRKKIVETSRRRYGTDNPNQSELIKLKIKNTNIKKLLEEKSLIKEILNIKENIYTIKEASEILEGKDTTEIKRITTTLGEPLIKGKYKFFIKDSTLEKLKKFIKDSCPRKMSFGEKLISDILGSLKIRYTYQYRNPFCKNIYPLSFDFYIPDYNICIEYQGEQHFKPIFRWGKNNSIDNDVALKDFEKNQFRDQIKRNFCYENDIILLEPDYKMKKKEIENMIKEALGI